MQAKKWNKSISALELADQNNQDASTLILDVRKASEFKSEHIKGAINAPLDFINDSMSMIDKDKTYFVHCAGGYRSMIFISILKARGFDHLIDVKGGFKDIKDVGKFKITEYKAPTTLLL